jgi:hypothetical protein
MRKRSCTFFIASVVGALFPLVACAYTTRFQSRIEGDGNRASDRPELNSSAHNLVVLRGQKDSSIELWLGLEFVTTSDQCRSRSLVQSMVGAPIVEQSFEDFVRVPAGQTNFSVQFFLDRYLPGRCAWRPTGFDHVQFVPELNSGPVSRSGVTGVSSRGRRELTVEWVCQQKSYSLNGTNYLPLHLSCLAQNTMRMGYPPISTDGAVIDMNFRLMPGVGH